MYLWDLTHRQIQIRSPDQSIGAFTRQESAIYSIGCTCSPLARLCDGQFPENDAIGDENGHRLSSEHQIPLLEVVQAKGKSECFRKLHMVVDTFELTRRLY